jgi:hypothetical protein
MVSGEGALTQASVNFSVAPVLYAVALRPDDPVQLRTAVGLACEWWGGIRFPWLPLNQDGAVADGAEKLCGVLDVAGIIDLTRPDGREPVSTGLESLGLPVLPASPRLPLALPVRGAVAAVSADPLVTAGEMDDAAFDPVSLLGLGGLSAGERAAWQEKGQPITVAPVGGSLLPQLSGRTAVGVTAAGADQFISGSAFGISAALVWLLPDAFTLTDVARDLAGFWNYRALRLRHRETVTVLARLSELSRGDDGRRLAEAVSGTALSTPSCVLNGLAVGDAALRQAAESLGFRVIPVDSSWTERRYRPEEPVELTAAIDHRLAGWWQRDRWSGAGTDILAVAGPPSWQARIQSPLRWHYPEALGGVVSVRVASPVITGPRTDNVAGLYEQHGRWRDGGVRFRLPALLDYHLEIGMPEPATVLAAALASRGTRYEVSDKGREIGGVLAASDDLGLFRQSAFHAVTAAMTPHPSPRIEKALARIPSQITADPDVATVAQELRDITARARAKPMTLGDIASHREVHERGLSRQDVSSVLAAMVARGLARWGFERRCDLCGLSELVPLADAAPVPRCTGCGMDAAYVIRDGEPELHYVLGSLLLRVSRNGGLAPLAGAAAFRQQGWYIVPGADIPAKGERETDLLGWKSDKLLTGEAKTAAALFTAENIARDLEWAASIGATSYVLICPQTLPNPLIEQAQQAASTHDVELLQLTGPDLTSGIQPSHAVFQIAAAALAEEQAAAESAADASAAPGETGESPPAADIESNQTQQSAD